MAQQYLLAIMARTLCSYPLSGNIVVLSGVTQGDILTIALACTMVPDIVLVLVDDREDRLAEAKASIVSQNPAMEKVVHTFAAGNMDQDRVGSIFVTIQSRYGIPKGLIIGNASRRSRTRLLEYSATRSIRDSTADDMITFLDCNDDHKRGLVRNFLGSGSNQGKTIINISRVTNTFIASLLSEKETSLGLLFAHIQRNEDCWEVTAQGSPGNYTSTRLFKSASERHNYILESGRFGIFKSSSCYNHLTSD